LIFKDDEPFNNPEEDQEIKSSFLQMLTLDIPANIKEGFSNQE